VSEKTAGESMGRRVLVFAGAGASKAVNSDSYPTTADFFNRLPEAISSNQYFRLLLEYLRSRSSGQAKPDIEVVLWHFQELKAQMKAMASRDQFLGWLLESDRMNKPLGSGGSLGAARHAATAGLGQVDSLVSAINRQVFEFYKRPPETAELDVTWLPLLRGLAKSDFSVEVATTNYDVVLEYALEKLEADGTAIVNAGWKSGVYRKLDLDQWSRDPFGSEEGTRAHGLLTKLHGSVNWSRDGADIYISDPAFKGQDDRHAIIYPGFKGRPTEEPFSTMHQYLVRCLATADALVFIGFAFRDEYVNDLCERYVRPQARVYVVNPGAVTRLPFREDAVTPVVLGMGEEATSKLLSYLTS